MLTLGRLLPLVFWSFGVRTGVSLWFSKNHLPLDFVVDTLAL